jgi:hypothetical protein
MYVRKLLASMALATLAVPAGLMALPQEAAAHQVAWEIYNTYQNGGPFAATLDASIKTMTMDHRAVLKIASSFDSTSDAGGSLIDPNQGEKYYGMFDAVEVIDKPTTVDFYVALASPTPPGSPNVPEQIWAGRDFAFQANNLGRVHGINPAEMLSLALLFSEKSSLSDEQLARMIVNPEGDRLTGQALNCNGEQRCSTMTAPIPSAIWLFASALLGLLGVGYRRREMVAPA